MTPIEKSRSLGVALLAAILGTSIVPQHVLADTTTRAIEKIQVNSSSTNHDVDVTLSGLSHSTCGDTVKLLEGEAQFEAMFRVLLAAKLSGRNASVGFDGSTCRLYRVGIVD